MYGVYRCSHTVVLASTLLSRPSIRSGGTSGAVIWHATVCRYHLDPRGCRAVRIRRVRTVRVPLYRNGRVPSVWIVRGNHEVAGSIGGVTSVGLRIRQVY